MRNANSIKAVMIIIAAVYSGRAQTLTWDFEDGVFPGWTQTGKAFAGQPVCKRPQDPEMPSAWFADARLGGNYWQGLAYPLGQHGNCVVSSTRKINSPEPWSLTSPQVTLPNEARFLSFLVGGTNDVAHQRLELQLLREGTWAAVYQATGSGGGQHRQDVFEIPSDARGLPARIRIVDDSSSGHINIDYIQFTHDEPLPAKLPVWGYADYHTHPVTNLAFGSNDKRHIIWGSPGGAYENYVRDPSLINKDIAHCKRGHGGGYLAEAFINNAQLFDDSIGSIIKAFLLPHKRSGGPQFLDFPDHLMGAHQQMHITMIRRNYEGGLRLMVALVTDNWGAGFLTGVTEHGKVPLVKEKDTVVTQMNGLRD